MQFLCQQINSFMGMVQGVIAKFSPFTSTASVAASSVLEWRLTTTWLLRTWSCQFMCLPLSCSSLLHSLVVVCIRTLSNLHVRIHSILFHSLCSKALALKCSFRANLLMSFSFFRVEQIKSLTNANPARWRIRSVFNKAF